MNKRIVSKVGKRHRPDIDMMEFIQVESIREFDLDRHTDNTPLTMDDIDSLLSIRDEPTKPIKKKSQVYTVENEQIVEFGEEIENQE